VIRIAVHSNSLGAQFRRATACAPVALALGTSCQGSASSNDEALFDQLAKQPGAQVREEIAPDGSLEKDILLPSGVAFTRRQLGDKVSNFDEDRSGHGAVLCVWSLYIALSVTLEACGKRQDDELRQHLAAAIDKINDFIVVNSLTVVTKDDVERRVQQSRAAHWKQVAAVSAEEVKGSCVYGDAARMIAAFSAQKVEGRREALEKLLSVPRPPLLNPCL
jgi:hypothetical protein